LFSPANLSRPVVQVQAATDADEGVSALPVIKELANFVKRRLLEL
jgi:hypothetical protein